MALAINAVRNVRPSTNPDSEIDQFMDTISSAETDNTTGPKREFELVCIDISRIGIEASSYSEPVRFLLAEHGICSKWRNYGSSNHIRLFSNLSVYGRSCKRVRVIDAEDIDSNSFNPERPNEITSFHHSENYIGRYSSRWDNIPVAKKFTQPDGSVVTRRYDLIRALCILLFATNVAKHSAKFKEMVDTWHTDRIFSLATFFMLNFDQINSMFEDGIEFADLQNLFLTTGVQPQNLRGNIVVSGLNGANDIYSVQTIVPTPDNSFLSASGVNGSDRFCKFAFSVQKTDGSSLLGMSLVDIMEKDTDAFKVVSFLTDCCSNAITRKATSTEGHVFNGVVDIADIVTIFDHHIDPSSGTMPSFGNDPRRITAYATIIRTPVDDSNKHAVIATKGFSSESLLDVIGAIRDSMSSEFVRSFRSYRDSGSPQTVDMAALLKADLTKYVSPANNIASITRMSDKKIKVVLCEEIFPTAIRRNGKIYRENDPGTVLSDMGFSALVIDFSSMRSSTQFPNIHAYRDEECTVNARHSNIHSAGHVCLGDITSATSVPNLNDFFVMMRTCNLDSAYNSSKAFMLADPNSVTDEQWRLMDIPGISEIEQIVL